MASGKSAARAGDDTRHTPLGPVGGSPNVRIERQPAWRALLDMHSCPQVTGTVAHVGGVAAPGSAKVRINRFPAARVGDQIGEIGPPNEITSGSGKVKIGG